jgi:oligopeptide/dipeptide ABC transporter ATP-binding protein
MSRKQSHQHAVGLLERVGVPSPAKRAKQYPHEFSGGMRQRVMISIALSCDPELIIADEPTTALDVTVQAQILELMKDLQRENGMSVIFITHDLGVVADVCDRVCVMYAGQIVEQAEVHELYASPRHPYSEGLLAAMPRLDAVNQLAVIPGHPPAAGQFPHGCRFHPRCAYEEPACLVAGACGHLEIVSSGRQARCVRTSELSLQGSE